MSNSPYIYAAYPTANPDELTLLLDLQEGRVTLDSYHNVGVEARFVRISPQGVTSFTTNTTTH